MFNFRLEVISSFSKLKFYILYLQHPHSLPFSPSQKKTLPSLHFPDYNTLAHKSPWMNMRCGQQGNPGATCKKEDWICSSCLCSSILANGILWIKGNWDQPTSKSTMNCSACKYQLHTKSQFTGDKGNYVSMHQTTTLFLPYWKSSN